jgi:hypothetical protein
MYFAKAMIWYDLDAMVGQNFFFFTHSLASYHTSCVPADQSEAPVMVGHY